jgi:arsenate reductase (thioredoxin)
MDASKNVLILSKGLSSRGQMVEAYLKHYTTTGHFTGVTLDTAELHPVSIQVMAEDNIDLTEFPPKKLEEIKGRSFDYLIVLGQEKEMKIPHYIKARQSYTISLPDLHNQLMDDEAQLEIFREHREQIKRSTLKFIGKNLLQIKGDSTGA